MKIDISDIIKNQGASLDIFFNEKIPESDNKAFNCVFDRPVKFTGTLENNGGELLLQADLDTVYSSACDRCAEPMESQIALKVEEEIVTGDKAEADEIYVYDGKYLDIGKIIMDNILLKLPMKQLCKSTCKGLCPKCGCNLNEKQCNCGDGDANMHFGVLKNIFNNSGKNGQ
ncbi:MAG: DUF177 domain-containing protein [Eubacteriales bacterium]|nr:DUF177 domain-containing protein [Eubacteriales bacterium]